MPDSKIRHLISMTMSDTHYGKSSSGSGSSRKIELAAAGSRRGMTGGSSLGGPGGKDAAGRRAV
jgi:hypothetical protein